MTSMSTLAELTHQHQHAVVITPQVRAKLAERKKRTVQTAEIEGHIHSVKLEGVFDNEGNMVDIQIFKCGQTTECWDGHKGKLIRTDV